MKDAIKHIEHFITELLFRQCILLKSRQSLCLFLGGFYSLQYCQSKASLKFSVRDRTHTKRTGSSQKIFASSSPGAKFQTKVTSCRNFPQCEEYQTQSTDMSHITRDLSQLYRHFHEENSGQRHLYQLACRGNSFSYFQGSL